jgi:hypothetical protein
MIPRRHGGNRGYAVRMLSILVATLCGTSCVPPSCIDRSTFSYSPAPKKLVVLLDLFAKPIKDPKTRYSTGVGMWELYASGASIEIHDNGKMEIATLSKWPQSCTKISQDDLDRVSRYWEPVLKRLPRPHCDLLMMPNPPTGKKDWRPDGPMVELWFGSTSGQSVWVLWDGQSTLPKDLDSAVMGTLELMRSKNGLAKKYLSRNLPPQVSHRLERENTTGGDP